MSRTRLQNNFKLILTDITVIVFLQTCKHLQASTTCQKEKLNMLLLLKKERNVTKLMCKIYIPVLFTLLYKLNSLSFFWLTTSIQGISKSVPVTLSSYGLYNNYVKATQDHINKIISCMTTVHYKFISKGNCFIHYVH